MAVFNSAKTFLVKPVQAIRKPIGLDKDQVVFENLPYGMYAVTLFQDLNNNQKLDMFFVVPSEPWGLSNNVKPMGPPSFDPCRFVLNQPEKKIEIQVQ